MKQKKDNKKVQNWHKPYNPKYKLGQRGFKLKNEKVSLKESLNDYFAIEPKHENDSNWDYLIDPMANAQYRPGWDCCNECYYESIGIGRESDLCNYNYHRLYERAINFHYLESIIENDKTSILKKNDVGKPKLASQPIEDVEKKLYQHIRNLINLNGNETQYIEKLRNAIGSVENVDFIKNNVDPRYSEFMTKCAVLLSPFWLKKPLKLSFKKGENIIDHIFCKYKYPKFLLRSWFEEQDHLEYKELSFKWISWLLIISQGGSLRVASKYFGWNISSKFQHFLLQVPDEIHYPKESCIYAEVLSLGGSRKSYQRIMDNRSLVIDPSENCYNKTYLEFWKKTVKWLIDHEELISDDESNMILSWATHRYTESERDNQRNFSWRGRSLQNILVQSRDYQEDLNKDYSDDYKYIWQSHDLNWTFVTENGDNWEFIELISGVELYEESKYMGHCVSMYVAKCISGSSAIFSLKLNGGKKLTIELAPLSGRIVQALGKLNRMAKPEEKEIVRLWNETVVLKS